MGIKRTFIAMLFGGLLAAAGTGIARADSEFVACPSGMSGIATQNTSCPFADNVRRAYYSQGGSTVVAYSPVTGQAYVMDCVPGYIAHFAGGGSRVAVKCFGGTNAEVVVW